MSSPAEFARGLLRRARDLERLTPLGVAARYEGGLDPSFVLDRNTTRAEIATVIAWGQDALSAPIAPDKGSDG